MASAADVYCYLYTHEQGTIPELIDFFKVAKTTVSTWMQRGVDAGYLQALEQHRDPMFSPPYRLPYIYRLTQKGRELVERNMSNELA